MTPSRYDGAMQRVIQRSLIITLEIVSTGMSNATAERVTAAIAGAWLSYIGPYLHQQTVHNPQTEASPALPSFEVTMRRIPFCEGAQIQILMCWIVLQTQRQESSDFERY